MGKTNKEFEELVEKYLLDKIGIKRNDLRNRFNSNLTIYNKGKFIYAFTRCLNDDYYFITNNCLHVLRYNEDYLDINKTEMGSKDDSRKIPFEKCEVIGNYDEVLELLTDKKVVKEEQSSLNGMPFKVVLTKITQDILYINKGSSLYFIEEIDDERLNIVKYDCVESSEVNSRAICKITNLDNNYKFIIEHKSVVDSVSNPIDSRKQITKEEYEKIYNQIKY